MSHTDSVTIPSTTSTLTSADRWDHVLARWGVRRSEHRVEPGVYALGSPAADAPVFVTANYTLSFDALRSALKDIDGYILVLDTRGINVWCAAGKGTFGTDELVRRIEATALDTIVDHRVLILPQLGAAGVAAHEVKKRTGFKVEYGPVRAADLPAYLAADPKSHSGKATPEMRRVRFGLLDRLTLVPVELAHVFWPTLIAALILFFVDGWTASAGVVAAVLSGVVLFPILLPWLPTTDFSSKGLLLGLVTALPFALSAWSRHAQDGSWLQAGWALVYLLALPPVTAYLALNFTGSTTFTSRTGVEREIAAYIPVMGGMFGTGTLLMVVSLVFSLFGGA